MKVPNTSTFSLQNVVDVVQPISPGTPKISLLYKSSVAQDVTVSCNGYFYIMYWQGNNSLTVSEFVITHSGLYGDLLLIDEGGGYFSFVGPIGIDYGDAIITGTGNTSVVQQQPTGAGLISTLQGCFQYANNSLFDSNYSGSKNSLYNFRNYGDNKLNLQLSATALNMDPTYVYSRKLVQSEADGWYAVTIPGNFYTNIRFYSEGITIGSNWGTGNISISTRFQASVGMTAKLDRVYIRRTSSDRTVLQTFEAVGNDTVIPTYGSQFSLGADRTLYCTFTAGSSSDMLLVDFRMWAASTGTVYIRVGQGSYINTFIQI